MNNLNDFGNLISIKKKLGKMTLIEMNLPEIIGLIQTVDYSNHSLYIYIPLIGMYIDHFRI